MEEVPQAEPRIKKCDRSWGCEMNSGPRVEERR